MIIQMVKFKSGLSDHEARRIMEERKPGFEAQPGLVQKFYGYKKETGEYTGIYLWDSEKSMKTFRETELAKTIPVAYQAQGAPGIETFEVLHQLRG